MGERRIGHYQILERIGRGGMGEIYTARDEKLERVVAVKAISPDLLSEESARRRFFREARAAAALNHPFICTVHEVLEEEDQPFIIMEYVQGETVRARLTRGLLAQEEICRLGLEVAEALSAAHAQGIVHRDIKSSNIMITRSGHAKVMDFGLARLLAPPVEDPSSELLTLSRDLTQGGITVGTLAYMAPEQLRGESADAGSDLYSLGVVLYEMATGRLPFADRATPVLISEILNRIPRSPRTLNPELSWGLERLILRLLEKSPEARPESAESVARELRNLASRAPEGGPAARRSVAVLPFKDLARDPANAHLGPGLADVTITELALVKSLLVRPTAAILRYVDVSVDPVQAGRELSVDAVVDGSFQRSGSRLRVTVQLIGTAEGRPLWATKIDTSLDDIFRMQDEVSRRIAEALQVELTPGDERRLARTARPVGEAYELYLKGRIHLFRETISDVNLAIDFFEKARQADPDFALAYAGLSDAYARIAFTWEPEGDWYARAEAMCQKALALDPQLPEGRYLRGRLLWSPKGDFDHAGAMREFFASYSARPSLNEAHDWMGILLFHVGLFEESERELEQALAISPEDMIAYIHLGFVRFLKGRYGEALEISREAVRRAPSSWAYYQTALCQLQLGRSDEAERTAEQGSRQFPGDVLFYSVSGVAAFRGDRGRARQQIQLIEQNKKSFGHYHHAQYDLACIHALLGDGEEALESLTQTVRNGFPCHPFFERDSLLSSIRGDERFGLLMDELKAECGDYAKLYQDLQSSRPPDSGPAA